MALYKNPYDTPTFGQSFKPEDISSEIQKAIANEELKNEFDIVQIAFRCGSSPNCPKTVNPLCIVNNDGYSKKIRSFFAPLIVFYKDSVYIVSDYRLLVTKNQDFTGSGTISIKSGKIPDFNLYKDLQTIGELTYIGASLKSLASIPQKVFSMWLAVSISRRYSLDFKDQYILNVIFGVWFNSLFIDQETFKGEPLDELLMGLLSNPNHDRELLSAIKTTLEDGFKLATINDAIDLSKKFVTNLTYIGDFNLNVLMSLISNTYYSLNGKELIAMSLEYPGIFMAILYNVVTDKTFKKSVLMTIAEKFSRKQELTTFIEQYSFMVKSKAQE